VYACMCMRVHVCVRVFCASMHVFNECLQSNVCQGVLAHVHTHPYLLNGEQGLDATFVQGIHRHGGQSKVLNLCVEREAWGR
jgi:hypothetical protein